jgi:hypothetical protein
MWTIPMILSLSLSPALSLSLSLGVLVLDFVGWFEGVFSVIMINSCLLVVPGTPRMESWILHSGVGDRDGET